MMADKKGKGLNVKISGKTIDHVGTMLGKTIDKVAGDKLKVDAEKLGKKLDSKNITIDLDKKKK